MRGTIHFASDRDVTVNERDREVTDEERAAATRVVQARCGDDAEHVLKQLGLADYPRAQWKRSRK